MPPPRVAVCMATYRPEPARFAAQVDSIRHQTLSEWHCWVVDDGSGEDWLRTIWDVIGDDDRFTVVEHEQNVGFYRNFERALTALPASAPWIALADQDDLWRPEKLATLLTHGQGSDTRLVYSDVEVMGPDGEVMSPTYWVGRRHNEDDLAALLFANTVTGAASLVRREVVDAALPFPTSFGTSFHDHWLALVARCTGTVRYVDQPLHVYVQHQSNAIGHQPGSAETAAALLLRNLRRTWWRRPQPRYYDDEVARLADLAEALLSRVPDLDPPDRRVLTAVRSLHGTRPALGWLVRQSLREAVDPSVTMWRRRRVLASVAWTQVERAQTRVRCWTSRS